jgi:hypothetical protein
MKKFSTSLALSLIKASILTVIVLVALLSLSSCERVADRDRIVTNEWQARVLKTGRKLTVKNTDSLAVLVGDTVSVFVMDSHGPQSEYYYIVNMPEPALDTMTMEMYIDSKDTIYEKFESWNVVLERRVIK